MSFESENTEEISEAAWDRLCEEAQDYLERIASKRKEGSASCEHILGNLGVGASYVLIDRFLELGPAERLRRYKAETNALNYIKRYFKLCDDFPEFAEKEFASGEGYFPQMLPSHKSTELVDMYEQALRGQPEGGAKE